MVTEQIVVGIYLRYLPEDLGAQVPDLANADLETLYTAAKFAAAREDRCTTHPLLRDVRDPTGANGDVTGLFKITGELTGSPGPALAGREERASPLSITTGVNRPGASLHEEGAGPPVPDHRREGFPDRHAWLMMSSPFVPPRPYVPRTRYGFGDVPGRDHEHPVPRHRVVDRRYSAQPRPARWPQVHMMNVQPLPPEVARSERPNFHPMAPRRAAEFQPAAVVAAGWNPF